MIKQTVDIIMIFPCLLYLHVPSTSWNLNNFELKCISYQLPIIFIEHTQERRISSVQSAKRDLWDPITSGKLQKKIQKISEINYFSFLNLVAKFSIRFNKTHFPGLIYCLRPKRSLIELIPGLKLSSFCVRDTCQME